MKKFIAVGLVLASLVACGQETKTRTVEVEKPIEKIVTVSAPAKDLDAERQIAELLNDVYAQRAEIEALEAEIAELHEAIQAGDDEHQELARQAALLQRLLTASKSNEAALLACIVALETYPNAECTVNTLPQ